MEPPCPRPRFARESASTSLWRNVSETVRKFLHSFSAARTLCPDCRTVIPCSTVHIYPGAPKSHPPGPKHGQPWLSTSFSEPIETVVTVGLLMQCLKTQDPYDSDSLFPIVNDSKNTSAVSMRLKGASSARTKNVTPMLGSPLWRPAIYHDPPMGSRPTSQSIGS